MRWNEVERNENYDDPEAVAWRRDMMRRRAPLPRNMDEALGRLREMGGDGPGGLTTVNAPRPVAIDAETLVRCLWADVAEKQWQPHLEAFFDEVHPLVLHSYVGHGLVTFRQLHRARAMWVGGDWLDRRAAEENERRDKT